MEAPTLTVEGKELAFSNLDKVFYPSTGFTKGQLIDYYARISAVLLPHLKDRPVTLKRYPNGAQGPFFYEKQCPPHRPKWVKTAAVWSKVREGNINFCLFNDLPTLLWAANLAVLEIHASLSLKEDANTPTIMAFDLDPGEGCTIVDCCQVALWLKDALSQMGLECFPKTSGSKGMQLYVPLNTPVTYDQTKSASLDLALRLEAEHPDRVLHKMRKDLRASKIFIDWSQNDRHKTTVSVYSLRAKERPTVSTPVEWKEVTKALKARQPALLDFTCDQTVKRADKSGDLFQPLLTLKQRLK
jgi:bifunctional non-homologous end joining protein LigD